MFKNHQNYLIYDIFLCPIVCNLCYNFISNIWKSHCCETRRFWWVSNTVHYHPLQKTIGNLLPQCLKITIKYVSLQFSRQKKIALLILEILLILASLFAMLWNESFWVIFKHCVTIFISLPPRKNSLKSVFIASY